MNVDYVRLILAAGVGFLLTLLLGRLTIPWLKMRCRERLPDASPRLRELHREKQLTPGMGGLFVLAAFALAILTLADWQDPTLQIELLAVAGFASIGLWDDVTKLRGARRGVSARTKLLAQTCVATVAVSMLYLQQSQTSHGLERIVPLSGQTVDLGLWFLPLALLAIVGSSNAVNLADGLDGLASGCLLVTLAALGAVGCWGDAGELQRHPSVLLSIAVATGTLGGFLWFNRHPARVFLGDVGSLPLGALLGFVAVALKQELLLSLVGGVFVIEAASVILQVASFRLTGRRALLCAPLHHHFQFAGWTERTIVRRFWLAALLCAVAGVTLAAG